MGLRALVLLLLVSLAAGGYFAYRWRRADARRIETLRWTHTVMDSLAATVSLPQPQRGGSEGY
jgi:hypothetical protein